MGSDILFTDSSGNKFSHEIENYTATTGNLIAWVNVSTVSHTSDTTLLMYYGNAGVANQQNSSGTWNSNYKGVGHLPNGTSLTANDSTSNGNNGSATGGMTGGVGKIGGGAQYPSSNTNDNISIADNASLDISAPYTPSIWFNINPTAPGTTTLFAKNY